MYSNTPRKPKRLAEDLVSRISQYIRDGVLKPGDKLPSELELAAAEGFSRSVVRDAILRLQLAGLLETRRSVGTFVIDVPPPTELSLGPEIIDSFEEVVLLLEFRMGLELKAAALAAQNRDAQQLQEILLALNAIREKAALKSGVSIQADFNFHLKIAKASGNRYLFDIMKHLGAKLIPRTKMNSAYAGAEVREEYIERIYYEHESIYLGIEAGNPEAAKSAMFLHLNNSRNRLIQAHQQKLSAYI